MNYKPELDVELDDTDPTIALPSAEDVHVQPGHVDDDPASQLPPDEDGQERLGSVDTDPATQLPSSEGDQTRTTLIDTAPTVQQPLSEHDQARLAMNAGIQRKILTPIPKLNAGHVRTVMAAVSLSALSSNPVAGAPSSTPSAVAHPTTFTPSNIHPPTLDIADLLFSTRSALRKPMPPVTPQFYFTSQKLDAAKDKSFVTPPPNPVITSRAPGPRKGFTLQVMPGAIGARIQSIVPQVKNVTGSSLLLRHRTLKVPHNTPDSAIKEIRNIVYDFTNQIEQSSDTLTQSDSPLLNLPGELRNRIYRFAIISPLSIELDIGRWQNHQPALLRTCKQVRIEALRLFYIENKITTNIHDWDPVVKVRCSQLLASHKIKSHHLYHYFTGGPNWTNLLAWLKAVFEGKIGGISSCLGKTRTVERKIVGGMFLYVSTTVKGTEWPHLLPQLELQREILGMNDPRWLL
jgi:hypothetical protein